MSLNNCTFHGRLTRDPELRYTQSQKPVVSFTLAVDRDAAGTDGKKMTDFIDCFAWNALAEHIAKWFIKGQPMIVNGRLESRSYTDSDGAKHTRWEIRALSTYFASPKADAQPQTRAADYTGAGELTDADEGNLPF